MDFKKIRAAIFLLGILAVAAEGKGNNWQQNGGNQWQVSGDPSYTGSQSTNQRNGAQNQDSPGRINNYNDGPMVGQGGTSSGDRWNPSDIQVRGEGSWNNGKSSQNDGGWRPEGTQIKDFDRAGSGNYQPQTPQGWTPADSQVKDNGKQSYGWNNQAPRRMWNPEDTQVKDADSWNSGGNQQGNRDNWGPKDSQVKNGEGNQPIGGSWGPSDAQAKDMNKWNAGNNQGTSGSFGPVDSQRKDSDRWNADGNYPSPGNFGPNDSQVKDLGRWNGGQNQKPAGPFVPSDSQNKSPEAWINGGNTKKDGGWNPSDNQAKVSEGWNRDSNNEVGGSRWGPGESQMKINEDWNRDGNKDSSRGMWGQGKRPNTPWSPDNRDSTKNKEWGPGPNEEGSAGNKWQPDQGPGPAGDDDWSANQGGISRPPLDQGPPLDGNQVSDGNQGRKDEGGLDFPRGSQGGVGNTDDDYGTGVNRAMGDAGILPETLPQNNGRVPQGNYKGGDTNQYPGDDPSQWRLEDSIPGTPGVDYPNYSTVPETGFDCKQHQDPGYYGDVEAQCQVFHICQADGRHDSFLCPLGTIFNQQYFVCVWWFNYDCEDTTMYYNLNADLYKGGHGAQGNFKGTPVGVSGSKDNSDNSYSTPQTVDSGDIGGTGRSDYGDRPTVGQVDSVIPPGVGNENVGPTGMVGLIPPTNTGLQPGNWGSNEGPGNAPGEQGDYRPIPEQPLNRAQGAWDGGDGARTQDGGKPDIAAEPVIPGRQNDGYGQGGINTVPGQNGGNFGQDSGKRNWGSQSGVGGEGNRNWGTKGGPPYANQGGRWGSGEDPTRTNWGNGGRFDGGKKGSEWGVSEGSVKGRKARSWGSGEVYDSGLDKRWGSDTPEIPFDGQEESWISLEEVPLPINQDVNTRSGVYEDGEQNLSWNKNPHEEQQTEFGNNPQQLPRSTDWETKKEDVVDSEHPGSWSDGESDSNLSEVSNKISDQGRRWRTLEESPGNGHHTQNGRTQTMKNNWWMDTLGRNVEDRAEKWKENENEAGQQSNNIQDIKDRQHIYGNWRSLNNNFDHDKDYGSVNNAKQQNWTK